jgi:hypothetical protein
VVVVGPGRVVVVVDGGTVVVVVGHGGTVVVAPGVVVVVGHGTVVVVVALARASRDAPTAEAAGPGAVRIGTVRPTAPITAAAWRAIRETTIKIWPWRTRPGPPPAPAR